MSDEPNFLNDGLFDPAATQADIYYCYRLILGRHPDPAGWAGLTRLLQDGRVEVDFLVREFLKSPEFKTRQTHFPELKAVEAVVLPDFELFVSGEDSDVGAAISRDRAYEPHVSAAIVRRLQPGMVFLDIGANIGYFSMLAARQVGPSGRVFSFEASQANAVLLFLSSRRNRFDNIQIIPFALSNSRGTWLYDSHGSNGNLVPFDGSFDLRPGRTLVYAMTLDSLIDDDTRADVVKIDIEGAEYMAIEGGRKLLARSRPVIFSEFSPPALQRISGKSGREYLELLQSFGYDFCILDPGGEETPAGADVQKLLDAFEKRRSTHIDIVAVPR